MPSPTFRRRFTQQPQYAALIDRSLIQKISGSAIVLPPNLLDSTTGKSPSFGNGVGLSNVDGPSGRSIALSGTAATAGGMQFTGVGGTEYTFIYHGSIETAASGYARFYADEAVSGNNQAYYDGASIVCENAASVAYTSSTKPATLVIVCTATQVKIYLNGVLQASTNRSVLPYANVCFFNRATDWQRQFKGTCALVGWIPRALPAALAQAISVNPWQIFLAPSLPIFGVTAGGGGATNYTLDCEVGSYSLTGNAATLTVKRNYALTCSAGTYTLSGKDSTLTWVHGAEDYTLACATGSYSLSGKDATLTYSPGNVKVDYTLSCAAGAYSLSGKDASLTYVSHAPTAYTLSCASGSYSLTGQQISLVWSAQSSKVGGDDVPEERVEIWEKPLYPKKKQKQQRSDPVPSADPLIQLVTKTTENERKPYVALRVDDDEDEEEILLLLAA